MSVLENEIETDENIIDIGSLGDFGDLSEIDDINEDDDIDIGDLDEEPSETQEDEVEEKTYSKLDEDILQLRKKQKLLEKEIGDFYKTYVSETLADAQNTHLLDNPNKYYQAILNLSPQEAMRLNKNVHLFLTSEQITTEIRVQTISAYWEYCETLIKEVITSLTLELRYMFRYGLLVTSAVEPKLMNMIKYTDFNYRSTDFTVYYIDEWLEKVSNGEIRQSILDETAINPESRLASQIHKVEHLKSQNEAQIKIATTLDNDIVEVLDNLAEKIGQLQNRNTTEYGFHEPFIVDQIKEIKTIRETINLLQNKNNSLETAFTNIKNTMANIKKTEKDIELYQSTLSKDQKSTIQKNEDEADKREQLHTKVTLEEFYVLRQMTKMCVGKKGNHFPIFIKNYFSGTVTNFATRDRVVQWLQEIEKLDYTLFHKEIRGNVNRVFPLVLLVPCYGGIGICWEPYERLNKNTTSAKIVIPMYSQDLEKAILLALGDFRWQFAKEVSGPLWMEEGLTGWYLQWFDANIKKGDVKEYFIKDYLLWMKWESRGLQKLPKETRELFWRHVPFNRVLRETLAKRAPIYNELMKKERNREISILS